MAGFPDAAKPPWVPNTLVPRLVFQDFPMPPNRHGYLIPGLRYLGCVPGFPVVGITKIAFQRLHCKACNECKDCIAKIALQKLHCENSFAKIAVQRLHRNDCFAKIALQRLHCKDCKTKIALQRLYCNAYMTRMQYKAF